MFTFSDDDSWTFESFASVPQSELIDAFRERRSPGLVVFSSGSTGTPKGILQDCERVMRKFVQQRRGWRTVLFLMLDHFGGFNTLLSIYSRRRESRAQQRERDHDRGVLHWWRSEVKQAARHRISVASIFSHAGLSQRPKMTKKHGWQSSAVCIDCKTLPRFGAGPTELPITNPWIGFACKCANENWIKRLDNG